jgi:predicted lipoprotein with Yx(FWY)xxD motif
MSVREFGRTKRRGAPFVLAAVAVTALAACGSSTSTSKAQPTAPQTTASSQASGSADVATASNAKLGPLLVDSKGMTLYTLTSSGRPVACTGQCPKFWPPLLLPSGTSTARGEAGVKGLGTVSGAGGTQVTENGAPLYRFSGDAAAGDANGEGISSFGGVWHVVNSAASGAGTTETTNAPTTSTGSGYGY